MSFRIPIYSPKERLLMCNIVIDDNGDLFIEYKRGSKSDSVPFEDHVMSLYGAAQKAKEREKKHLIE